MGGDSLQTLLFVVRISEQTLLIISLRRSRHAHLQLEFVDGLLVWFTVKDREGCSNNEGIDVEAREKPRFASSLMQITTHVLGLKV